jgi:hypothetical protein
VLDQRTGWGLDKLWIDAPSGPQAERLIALLVGFDARSVADGDHGTQVRISLDDDTALLLVRLFDSVGNWLSDDNLASCQVHFGDRTYTLLQPSEGETSDPREFLLERTIQLQRALDSRIVIEQAKGILAQLLNIEIEEGFEVLRNAARASGQPIRQVAREVIRRRAVPNG